MAQPPLYNVLTTGRPTKDRRMWAIRTAGEIRMATNAQYQRNSTPAHAHVQSNSTRPIGRERTGTYITARASEYLVKTGAGVKGAKWGRTFWRLVGQNVTVVDMKPRNIAFDLHGISRDLVPFDVPVTFTIQVHDPMVDPDGFLRYAQRLNSLSEAEFYTVLHNIIHGQTRILAGSLDVMEIFNGREVFKMKVQEKIEKELTPYGCSVTNANISELRDTPGEDNKYFETLKTKAISAATQEARIEVAENQKRGDVGTEERTMEAKTRIAAIEAENLKQQNERAQDVQRSNNELIQMRADIEANNLRQQNERAQAVEKSNNALKLVQIEYQKEQLLKRQEADNEPKQKLLEMQRNLNIQNADVQKEALRSTQLTKAMVDAEAATATADGQAKALKLKTDAELYARQKQAEAQLYAKQKEAEGILATKRVEAESILAIKGAEAEGLQRLLNSSSDTELVKFYLGLKDGLFGDVAGHLAQAVKGLNPKINIWTTGNGDGPSADSMAPLRNLFTTLPPLMDAVGSQAGMRMPSWAPQMPIEDQAKPGTNAAPSMPNRGQTPKAIV
ncbi:g3209 [Coccomyxa viridis]|uniref:Flotillin-like n=1 Tax=Coccomyxa viridis TaxID=1274662 RepID=A0ABP1FUA7_9CHLO